MSRKKAKKSNNCHIGIFSGKSANYNIGIIETLAILGGATAMTIAKTHLKRIDPASEKEPYLPGTPVYYRTQKIYSVIQRKGGRLEDLKAKGYITEENGVWRLTIVKGFVALYAKNPDFITNLIQENKDQFLAMMKNRLSSVSENETKEPFGVRINQKAVKQGVENLLLYLKNKPFYFTKVLEEAKKLLCEGIDLDRVQEETLVSLIVMRSPIRSIKSIINRKF